MSKIPVIVSSATKDTGYELEISNLQRSLVRFGYPAVQLEIVPNLGTWEANVRARPAFIKRMIEKTGGPVIWMDADSELLKFPDEFATIGEKVDFACCYFQWQKRHELSGAVLYFSGSPASIEVLDRWSTACGKWPAGLSQPLLQTVVEQDMAGKLNIKVFPVEYDVIYDLHANIKDPVIIQWQASRRLKRKLDRVYATQAERDIAYLERMFVGKGRAIILGKGDSVKGISYDRSRLVVIGINDIFKRVDDLDIAFFFDSITFSENKEGFDVLASKGVQIWTTAPHLARPFHRQVKLEATPYGCETGKFFHSFTSAYICLQLAIWAGCKEIFLAGIDLTLPEKGDYYDGSGAREGDKFLTHLAKMRPGFELLAKNLPPGVHVYRTSEISTLTCFPVVRPV